MELENRVLDFLEKNGALDILCVIPPKGIAFERMLEKVTVSRGTLYNRLEEGMRLDLWERLPSSSEDSREFTYMLTKRGELLRVIIMYHNLPMTLTELRMKEEEFEKKSTEVLGRMREYGVKELLEKYDEEYSAE